MAVVRNTGKSRRTSRYSPCITASVGRDMFIERVNLCIRRAVKHDITSHAAFGKGKHDADDHAGVPYSNARSV
eukprot:461008-Pleurochrysis_carterae.AAC.1